VEREGRRKNTGDTPRIKGVKKKKKIPTLKQSKRWESVKNLVLPIPKRGGGKRCGSYKRCSDARMYRSILESGSEKERISGDKAEVQRRYEGKQA